MSLNIWRHVCHADVTQHYLTMNIFSLERMDDILIHSYPDWTTFIELWHQWQRTTPGWSASQWKVTSHLKISKPYSSKLLHSTLVLTSMNAPDAGTPRWNLRAAVFSRCGFVFFCCVDFFGYKAGFSLVQDFFLPRTFFSLPPTVFPAAVSFFPLRRECILSAANLFFAVARCFFLLRWIFPAANRYCLLAFLPAADCPNIFFMPQNCLSNSKQFRKKGQDTQDDVIILCETTQVLYIWDV